MEKFNLKGYLNIFIFTSLLIEHEIYRQHQAGESSEMVPMQRLPLKQHGSEYRKDNKRHHFLNNLQLHQRKRTAIAYEPDTVCRNLKGIFT